MTFALQISTINLNRCGISAVDRVADFSCEFPFQIAALPEVDIPVRLASGFIHAWKRRQMFACLGNPESGVHRIALCSQVPLCPCVLNVDVASTRYAAGTFEVQGPSEQIETILVVAVYLQARNEAVAQQQASEIVAAAAATGLRYVLIGDFNLEQHQASLGHIIQSGGTHACDSCARDGNLSLVQHRECYFSDHLVVNYCFQPSAPMALSGPCRRKVVDRAAQHIDELFRACSTQEVVQAVQQGRLDEAGFCSPTWPSNAYASRATTLCPDRQIGHRHSLRWGIRLVKPFAPPVLQDCESCMVGFAIIVIALGTPPLRARSLPLCQV